MGGYNFFAKDGNAIESKGLLIVANEPTKNNSKKLAGDFGILNLEGFPQEVKCEAHGQSA